MNFRSEFFFSADTILKYEIPVEDTGSFAVPKDFNPKRVFYNDWYVFRQFERVGLVLSAVMVLGALNSFFISVKVVKYVGNSRSVRPFSFTLKTGRERNISFATIMLLGMIGFAMFFHIIFGHSVLGYETFPSALLTIFNWIVGVYDVRPLFEVDPFLGLLFFLIFMIAFYFVAVNMFLATMINTYGACVGQMDLERAKAMVEARHPTRVVAYPDKVSFEDDITLQLNEATNEFSVAKVSPGGEAMAAGVLEGYVVQKINGERETWKRETLARTMEQGICEDDLNGTVTITCKDVYQVGVDLRRNSKVKRPSGRKDAHNQLDKVTVRNFWHGLGAVGQISRMEKRKAREHLENFDDDASEDDEDGHRSGGAQAKAPTTARVQELLFSRWTRGAGATYDGANVVPGRFWELPGKDEPEWHEEADFDGENSVFDDLSWNRANLQETLEKQPITGHEVLLDCLCSALECEMSQRDYLIADLLRISGMDTEKAEKAWSYVKTDVTFGYFYDHVSEILRIMENRALALHFTHMRRESVARFQKLRSQNAVLNDYAFELERRYAEIEVGADLNRAMKQDLLRKWALAIDTKTYAEYDSADAKTRTETPRHMRQLTRPWRDPESERSNHVTATAGAASSSGG